MKKRDEKEKTQWMNDSVEVSNIAERNNSVDIEDLFSIEEDYGILCLKEQKETDALIGYYKTRASLLFPSQQIPFLGGNISDNKGSFSKTLEWIKDHPKTSIFGAILVFTGIVYAVYSSNKSMRQSYEKRKRARMRLQRMNEQRASEYTQKVEVKNYEKILSGCTGAVIGAVFPKISPIAGIAALTIGILKNDLLALYAGAGLISEGIVKDIFGIKSSEQKLDGKPGSLETSVRKLLEPAKPNSLPNTKENFKKFWQDPLEFLLLKKNQLST